MTNPSLLPDGPQNGLRNYYSTFWNSPFSTMLSFSSFVVQNFHPDYSDTYYKRKGECLEPGPHGEEDQLHANAN
jgi:hypothetical protein